MSTQGIRHVDVEIVRSYANDLRSLLEEANIAESKAFLRSFVKRIEINKSDLWWTLGDSSRTPV